MDNPVLYAVLADAVVIVHLAFIVFVVAGALLAAFCPKVIWIHLPCVAWGVVVELAGLVCPLTPLENMLRARAGQAGYAGDFVIHYIEPVIYPGCLTREIQVALAGMVLLVNAGVYTWLVKGRKR